MILSLSRTSQNAKATIGSLAINGVFFCFTLELPWVNNQPDISCIPEGIYPVVVTFSPHLAENTPELQNVPDREDIRIHVANWPGQIKGCIAVGFQKGDDAVYSSRAAFNTLMQKISEVQLEPISIEIMKENHP